MIDDADYISREAAIEIAMQYCPDDDGSCSKALADLRDLLDEIESIPAADVRPVEKARWVNLTPPEFRTDGESVFWMCSECRNAAVFLAEDLPYDFCPNCGADMREES